MACHLPKGPGIGSCTGMPRFQSTTPDTSTFRVMKRSRRSETARRIPRPAIVRARPIDPARRRREALQAGHRGVVHAHDGHVAQPAPERRHDVGSEPGHAERPALDDHHGSVAIDHQPGQTVGLAPHQPPGLGRSAGRARGQGGVDAASDEGRVDGLVGPGEDAAAERRAGVEHAARHEASARVADGDRLARRDAFFLRNGFYLFTAYYGIQRFAWEFLKPYPTVLGPFNLFHLVCIVLFAYSLVMLRRNNDLRKAV